MKYDSVTDAVGDTPYLKLGESPETYGKLEMLNPSGSMKDRIGYHAVAKASSLGYEYIVEASSGNTGIAVSTAAAAEGLQAIICVSEGCNKRKKEIIKSYGAEVKEAGEDLTHRELADEIGQRDDVYYYDQYSEHETNPHTIGTGREISSEFEDITHFVAPIGSGGTITGVSKALPNEVHVMGIDAERSNLTEIFEGKDFEPTESNIAGVGRHYQSDVLDFTHVDEIQEVTEDDCIEGAREVAREYGLSVGLSSGAVYEVMNRISDESAVVVGIFPDSGNRYLEELV